MDSSANTTAPTSTTPAYFYSNNSNNNQNYSNNSSYLIGGSNPWIGIVIAFLAASVVSAVCLTTLVLCHRSFLMHRRRQSSLPDDYFPPIPFRSIDPQTGIQTDVHAADEDSHRTAGRQRRASAMTEAAEPPKTPVIVLQPDGRTVELAVEDIMTDGETSDHIDVVVFERNDASS